MDLLEKRKQERDRQTEKRREEIKDAAILAFIEHGIDNANIADIAKRAQVGEATVYRYFESKSNLVIESATKLIGDKLKILAFMLTPDPSSTRSGFETVSAIFHKLGSVFDEYPEVLQFLEQLDNYIVREKITNHQLLRYEEHFKETRAVILGALQKGQKDGSVRPDIDVQQFYTVTTHAIVSLSQKLLLRGNIMESDSDMDRKTQISMLIEMSLFYIKNTGV